MSENHDQRFDTLFCQRATESRDGISPDDFIGFVRPKCREIITLEALRQQIESRSPLKVKFGIDPTGSDIHLGHVVPILLLGLFARAGHLIDFVIGDFTARIGDPTARETGRVPIGAEQIAQNMSSYTSQVGKYLDVGGLRIHQNSEWLNTMGLPEIFTLFQGINLAEAMQRDDFRSRLRNDQGVSLAELCYGILMGVDSVQLSSDVEIGGIDQLLNFQQCRKVMRQSGLAEETILMTPILEGTSGDGRKMSKSFGNYIAVNDSAEDKFGKIMSIPDRLIQPYFCCFADVHEDDLLALGSFIVEHPFEAKKQLATIIVALEAEGIQAGLRERDSFERKFSQGSVRAEDALDLPAQPQELLVEVLFRSGSFASKSELRRLFEQRAVKLCRNGGEQTLGLEATADASSGLVKVGKRRFFNVICGEVPMS